MAVLALCFIASLDLGFEQPLDFKETFRSGMHVKDLTISHLLGLVPWTTPALCSFSFLGGWDNLFNFSFSYLFPVLSVCQHQSFYLYREKMT